MEAPQPNQEAAAGAADWRSAALERIRQLIVDASPGIVEEVKWRKPTRPEGVPVWSCHGLLCTGETHSQYVKLTFAHGADLPDPAGLFNAGLEGNTRRAINIREGVEIDAAAFRALVRAAVARNDPSAKHENAARGRARSPLKPNASGVTLLSGGNPQIAKGDGDVPVQSYIAAMPGWKQDIGRQLDDLVVRLVPGVKKAVRWNSPFYGVEGQGYFLTAHCLTKYVKITFFKGSSLDPMPPGFTPKSGESRWVDVFEKDGFPEVELADWIRQAAELPGWTP